MLAADIAFDTNVSTLSSVSEHLQRIMKPEKLCIRMRVRASESKLQIFTGTSCMAAVECVIPHSIICTCFDSDSMLAHANLKQETRQSVPASKVGTKSANSGSRIESWGIYFMEKTLNKMSLWRVLLGVGLLLGLVLVTIASPIAAAAQDDQDDPPTRVARLAYMEGSVSFQPAGEDEWVGAVPNRPLTTGDKLWVDQGSRAELQLGTAVIRIAANTGISFLNLDDHTIQVQLSSGSIDIRVRRLDDNDDIEIDTPNLALTALRAGRYRFIIRDDGNQTIIGVRAGGDGEATGSGQTYEIQSDEVGYFDGANNSLNADVEPIPPPDGFDAWVDSRDHRWDSSRSAQYLSHDVVGFDDLDDNGDWRDDGNYGHVWYPHVEVGWAPYHTGHWAWIDPWGYTWVDDSPWGYAPFHYGRWVSVGGRWGWIAGPPAERPVYAPALVVFVGFGGGGGGIGANVAWFPLGPREVFVPSYPVSRTYMTQINVSSTTVNTTTVTNVYNTTIVNKSTTITNVTYANRTVPGAVMAVPQNTFASAQPVAKAAVQVTPQQIASASVSSRVAVAPTKAAVLGARASSAGHVTAPPAAVSNRQVVAKKTPPPPPVSFAKKQQAMAAHPGQPLARKEMAALRPAAAARPAVKVAPPGKPATPTKGHPPANAARPGQPAAQPANRPGSQPAPKPAPAAPAQPNRPAAAQPNKAPEPNRPATEKAAPNKAPEPSRPETNRAPAEKSAPEAKPEAKPAPAAHPSEAEPKAEPNRAPAEKPAQPAAHPPAAKPATPAAKPATPPKKPETPEEKKKREEEEKKPQGV